MAWLRSYGLACWLLIGCSGRTTPPTQVDPDAANADDAPPGAKDSSGPDGATGSDDASNADRCVADVYEGKALPVDLYVVVDMSHTAKCPLGERCAPDAGVQSPGETRWQAMTSAIERFAEASSGSSVGIGLFPRFSGGESAVSCVVDDYAAPDLPFGTTADAIQRLVEAQSPRGDWLLQAPLAGALRYARTHAEANPDRQTVVALMTHGSETNPCNDTIFDGAMQLAARAFAATPPVKTTAISLNPIQAYLGNVAAAGGMGWGYLISAASTDPQGDTLAALKDAATPSDYPLPDTPRLTRTLSTLVVQLSAGSDDSFWFDLERAEDAAHCSPGGGWYADNNQNPSRVSLCGNNRRLMSIMPGRAVRLVVGCSS
jgi:hypothetical protein